MLAVVVLVAAYFSLAHTLANVIVRAAPAKAHALASQDGRIAASAAVEAFYSAPTGGTDDPAALLARKALRRDPTAVDALNVLAMKAQLRGDTSGARDLFSYSLNLSRRDLGSRLWAIEEAVSRGDIKTALTNYDIALRTSPRAPDMLFPVLANAIDEARIRPILIDILASEPVWAEKFIDFAATSGPKPQATRLLFEEAAGRSIPIDDDARASVVNSLFAANNYRDAWDYYASFRDGATRDHSRDPEFTFAGETRTIFDWIALEHTTIVPGSDGERGVADFSVPPTLGGPLLQQYILLPPGTYRLSGLSTGISQSDQTRPYWAVDCVDGPQLGQVPLPNSDEVGGQFEGNITVGGDCPAQVLRLIANPSNDIAGVSGQIVRATLAPVAR